jgi:hypothetical protein
MFVSIAIAGCPDGGNFSTVLQRGLLVTHNMLHLGILFLLNEIFDRQAPLRHCPGTLHGICFISLERVKVK